MSVEITIKATKIEDVITDSDILDAVLGDLEDAIGDAEGAFVCTGELALNMIEDDCDAKTAKEAKKFLSKYAEKLVVFNADNISE